MKTIISFVLPFLLFSATATTTPAFAYGVQTKIANCVNNQILPDSACTPGAVLTTDIKTICVSGYTKTVRDVPLSEAKKVFVEYGIPYSQHANYEVDHLISLELGGSNDISNLWPESRLISDGSLTKDKVENYLHAQVCSGKITIQQAQDVISHNWVSAYSTMSKTSTFIAKPSIVTPVAVSKATTSPVTESATTTIPETKKSTSGLCHEIGTRYYNQTLNFTSYTSLDLCLKSGGRLPK